MLRIRVGGNIRRTANGEIRNYAQGDIIYTAERVIYDAPEIEFGKAEPHPQRIIPIALACVEFFPGEGPNPLSPSTGSEEKKMKYRGQFGFDFFRKKNSLYTDEKPFFDSLPLDTETGYFSENGSFKQYKTAQEQYEALCEEYKKQPISYRTAKEIKEGRESEEWLYYIPYLTLYSQEYVQSLTTEYKPVYEAYLSMSVEIETDLEKWDFEYDKNLFSHHLEIPLETKKCQPTRHVCNLKITCLKDFDREKEIRIYAYPSNCKGKHKLEQENMKELAGIIKVLPNSANHRKKVNILAVQLKTDVEDGKGNDIQQGRFYEGQIQRLHYFFNQAYIEPEIKFYKNKDGEDFLDLTKDPRFKENTAYIDQNGYIKNNNTARDKYINYLDSLIADEIKQGDIVLYFWGLEKPGVNGDTLLSSKRCFIYKNKSLNESYIYRYSLGTVAHEAFHSLGIEHTFYESDSNPQYGKYFFQKQTTGNIMDYAMERNFLYKWQWDLIRQEI
jgi:hypothetical protein